MKMCKPERNAKQAYALIIGGAVICVCVAVFAATTTEYKWLFQVAFLLIATVCIYIAARYTMTEIVYIVEADLFKVTKTVGRKTAVICSLSLSSAKAFIDKKEYESSENKWKAETTFNFCQNINASYWCYICELNGKTLCVKFEPNDAFVSEMRKAIDENAQKK